MEHEAESQKKREELLSSLKGFFSSSSESSAQETSKAQEGQEEKRQQILTFLKQRGQWLSYIFLAIVIYLSSMLRLQNIPLLFDQTLGKYIPQALDPHLFYRYAFEVYETGALMMHDAGRFIPLGTSTIQYQFMSHSLVFIHKVLRIFNPSVTLDYSIIVYPVITFAIAMIFFYLLSKRLFNHKIAILATTFLAFAPAFLYRTTAGFSDHEALGTMFMFMAIYFFIVAWQQKKISTSIGFATLSGLATGAMGLGWGGWKFLLLIFSLFTFIEFLLNKLERKDVYNYAVWVLGFVLVTTIFLPRFSITELLSSFTTGIAFFVLSIILVDLFITRNTRFKIQEKVETALSRKIPTSLISLTIAAVLGAVLIFTVVGPGEIFSHGNEIVDNLLHPLGNNRWELTVAEQSQPYFRDWVNSYGPQFLGIPTFLVLFMLGSFLVFYEFVKDTKYKAYLAAAYLLFIIAFTMSRYSAASIFNGVNSLSIATYLGSLVIFTVIIAVAYLYFFYKDQKSYKGLLGTDKKHIFILVWFLIMVIAARGAVRLLYIFTPITALLAAVASFWFLDRALEQRAFWAKSIAVLVLVLVIFSPFAALPGIVPTYYRSSRSQAAGAGPSYSRQWQLAGADIREQIPEDAIFAHWWDYGYWVQNGWGRRTILDGANRITYWNYLMGRFVMTGQNQEEALEWLKVHDASHFLIVSDEIGKYTAYSSIGSDEDYDRYSWITTFSLDQSQIQERRDSTVLFYRGGHSLDADLVYQGKVYPRQEAGIGAILLPVSPGEIEGSVQFSQPEALVVHQGQQTSVPLECIFINDEMLFFELPQGQGLKGCLRLVPTLSENGELTDGFGAGLYVSEKGVNALWANLYLFNQKNPRFDTSAFRVAYDQTQSFAPLAIFQNRIIGPIKVWEIVYPEGFTVDPQLEQQYLGGNENLPDYFFEV